MSRSFLKKSHALGKQQAMTSLGKDARTDNLTVNTIGNRGVPVQTIFRASGNFAVAIGAYAASADPQASNSICLNASGADLPCTIPASFIVKPIRNVQTANNVHYDSSTGEISYGKLHKGSWTVDFDGFRSTYLRFVTALFDDDSMMSSNNITTGGVVTIPATGKYTISHNIYVVNFDTVTDSSARVSFVLNGTEITASNYTVLKNDVHTFYQTQSRSFTAGDTLELRLVVKTGPALTVLATDPSNSAPTSFLAVIQIE